MEVAVLEMLTVEAVVAVSVVVQAADLVAVVVEVLLVV